MALINCPECNREVSDRDEDCPHCGCPLKGPADIVAGRRVRTVERTAKTYKAWMLVGCLATLAGLAGSLGGGLSGKADFVLIGVLVVALGLAVSLWARLAAWWHHG